MPFRVFSTTGARTWTPSSDGVTDGTTVRFHGVGSGGDGLGGDGIFQTGGGGGGGERCAADIVIATASNTLDLYVPAQGEAANASVTDPSGPTVYLDCRCGSAASGTTGAPGGTGGTGNLYTHNGGNGGDAGADSGGGGGAAGSDAAVGNNGANGGATTGGAGGAGATQFGASNGGGGGNGGNQGASGSVGSLYGGGGGGGSILGTVLAQGKQGLIVAAWGANQANYPGGFGDGFIPDSTGVGMVLTGAAGLSTGRIFGGRTLA